MNPKANKMFFETEKMLTNPVFDARLKLVVANSSISDREWPNEEQDLFRDLDGKGIQTWTQSEHIPFPLIDTAWGGNARWVRQFLKNKPGEHPDRVRWLALYVAIKWPEVYRHLIR